MRIFWTEQAFRTAAERAGPPTISTITDVVECRKHFDEGVVAGRTIGKQEAIADERQKFLSQLRDKFLESQTEPPAKVLIEMAKIAKPVPFYQMQAQYDGPFLGGLGRRLG